MKNPTPEQKQQLSGGPRPSIPAEVAGPQSANIVTCSPFSGRLAWDFVGMEVLCGYELYWLADINPT